MRDYVQSPGLAALGLEWPPEAAPGLLRQFVQRMCSTSYSLPSWLPKPAKIKASVGIPAADLHNEQGGRSKQASYCMKPVCVLLVLHEVHASLPTLS